MSLLAAVCLGLILIISSRVAQSQAFNVLSMTVRGNISKISSVDGSLSLAGDFSFYSNPEYDAIVNEAKVSTDPERRKELYEQALEIITTECPIAPLYFLPGDIAYQKDVKGVSFNSLLTFDLSKAYFE